MLFTDLITILAMAAYGVITYYAPDFPMLEEAFIALVLWLASRLGFISFKLKKHLKNGFLK